jgi:hypothetical protein
MFFFQFFVLCLLQWKATHKMGSTFNLKDKVGARIHLG